MKLTKLTISIRSCVGVGCAIMLAALLLNAQAAVIAGQAASDPQNVKGLEISVSGLTRGTTVLLGDCPPGGNTVRAANRPGDENEFVTLTLDVKVLPSYEPTIVRSPMVHDDVGNAYRSSEAFTDSDKEPSYSCDFSFRVPPGTQLADLVIEDVTFDLSGLDQ